MVVTPEKSDLVCIKSFSSCMLSLTCNATWTELSVLHCLLYLILIYSHGETISNKVKKISKLGQEQKTSNCVCVIFDLYCKCFISGRKNGH